MWKPGQIVTIRGIVCRVTKIAETGYHCCGCEFTKLPCAEYPCFGCISSVNKKLPSNCHLKKIRI